MRNLLCITPPTSFAVSVPDMRRHLRIDHEDDDLDIEDALAAAIAHFDGRDGILGGVCLARQTWRFEADANGQGEIALPLGPVHDAADVSVAVIQADGSRETFGETEGLRVIFDACGTRVTRRAGFPIGDRIEVTFTAGLDLPRIAEPIKSAIRLLAADLYENREAQLVERVQENPALARLVRPYRMNLVA